MFEIKEKLEVSQEKLLKKDLTAIASKELTIVCPEDESELVGFNRTHT